MTDTPSVPLQGNIALSRSVPSVESSVGKIIIIADSYDPVVIIDDGISNVIIGTDDAAVVATAEILST